MYLRLALFLVCSVALGLPVAKLLDVIDWSWWVIAAPLWLILVIVLFTLGALTVLLNPRPPRW